MPFVGRVRRNVKDSAVDRWWGDPIFFRFVETLDLHDQQDVEHALGAYFPTMKNVAASYYSTRKYDRPQPVLHPQMWALADHFTVRHFSPAMSGAKLTDPQTYAWTLRTWTTPGIPFTEVWRTKGEALVDERFWDFYANYQEADFEWDVLWSSTVKSDELRPPEKIELNELRTFLSSPLHTVVACGVMFYDMNQKLYSSTHTWSTIGRSTFLREWHDMLARLPHSACYGTDLSNQDASMCQQAMMEQAELRFNMLRREDRTPRNWRRCLNLYRQIVFSFLVLAKGEVVQKETGNPSGSVNTISDNTILKFKFLAYTWLMLWLEEYGNRLPAFLASEECEYAFYMDNVSANIIGDDGLWSISERAQKVWRPDRVRPFLASIFVIIKFEFEEAKRVNELEYCSHTTIIYFGQYVPVMDYERGIASLGWKGHVIDYEPGAQRIGFEPHYALRRALDIRREGFWNKRLFQFADSYARWIMTEFQATLVKPAASGPLAGVTLAHLMSSYMPETSLMHLYTMREGATKQSLKAPAANPVGAFEKLEGDSSTFCQSMNPDHAHWGAAGKAATHLVNLAAKPLGSAGRAIADLVTDTIGNPFQTIHTRADAERRSRPLTYRERFYEQHRADFSEMGKSQKRGSRKGSRKGGSRRGSKKPSAKAIAKAVVKQEHKQRRGSRKRLRGALRRLRQPMQKTGKRVQHAGIGGMFDFQHAQFRGEDLIVPLELTGGANGLGGDAPGTIVYQAKVTPTSWIPNSRCQRLVSMFEQTQFVELHIGFKSGQAPGNIGGALRVFYESDMDDVLPANYAAPTGTAQSNWLVHPGTSWAISSKKMQWFKVPVHMCKGPMGGWFFVDSIGAHSDAERYQGQIAIAIEEAWNSMGSSGAIPTSGLVPVGNLYLKYVIKVQVAAELGIVSGGANRLAFTNQTVAAFPFAAPCSSNTTLYPSQAAHTQSGATLVQAKPPATGNAWCAYAGSSSNLTFPMFVQNYSSGSAEEWYFPEPGLYYINYYVNLPHAADYDLAANNGSGWGAWTHVGSGAGSAADNDWREGDSVMGSSNSGPQSKSIVTVIDPVNDGFKLIYTAHAGSATYGSSSANNILQFDIFMLAPNIIPALRKMKMEARQEFIWRYQGQSVDIGGRAQPQAAIRSLVGEELQRILRDKDEERKRFVPETQRVAAALTQLTVPGVQLTAPARMTECKECIYAKQQHCLCEPCVAAWHTAKHEWDWSDRTSTCSECRKLALQELSKLKSQSKDAWMPV